MPSGENCSGIKTLYVFSVSHTLAHIHIRNTKPTHIGTTEKAMKYRHSHLDVHMGSLSMSATWLAKV